MTATSTDISRSTFNRPDTFFGICEAIGQDFGFNPLWLRLAFVPPVFFAPHYALLAYVALGLVVLASRLLFPPRPADRVAAVPTLQVERAPASASQVAATADIDTRLPLAA